MEEIVNPSVEISDYPVRRRKILRTYDFILPKFHLIPPKFYFAPPWRIFVCSLDIPDFLGRRVTAVGSHGRASVVSKATASVASNVTASLF